MPFALSLSQEPCRASDVWRGMLDALRERLHRAAWPEGGGTSSAGAGKTLSGLVSAVTGLGVLLIVLAAAAAQAVPGLSRLVAWAGTEKLAWLSVALSMGLMLAFPAWVAWRAARVLRGWCERGKALRLGLRQPWPVPWAR